MKKEIETVKEKIRGNTVEDIVKKAIDFFGKDSIALASSISIEDQVLTHILLSLDKDITIFAIDTGRFFEETYKTMEETEKKYGFRYKIYFPDYKKIEEMVSNYGINLFYNDVDKRKLCCQLRKVEPLQRALANLKCWICGLRREQSVTRDNIDFIEWDQVNGLYKLNPLYNWREKEVWDYIKKYEIPYNSLYDKGFKSIGCAPCTRAVKVIEDVRAGRWWWEDPKHKECGLHKR
ncbi:MAG: phosphoadenylyl-sulfate reductase [Chitinispirillaceae bacterium]|nr:phosphoadenylyl-sulfate reductase [Chitinispirillaceae bacterium]